LVPGPLAPVLRWTVLAGLGPRNGRIFIRPYKPLFPYLTLTLTLTLSLNLSLTLTLTLTLSLTLSLNLSLTLSLSLSPPLAAGFSSARTNQSDVDFCGSLRFRLAIFPACDINHNSWLVAEKFCY